ncbi:MAG: PRC-barrel domain-containing protein [Bacteroidia bacterium]
MEPYESKWADDTNHEFDISKGEHLRPLSEVDDFEMDEMDDVRGWDVLGSDGEKIGAVDDLLVDVRNNEIRYLDVEAVEELGREDIPRHLLIPIGAGHMNRNDDKVLLDELSKQELQNCPVFGGCPVTRDFENEVRINLWNDLGAGNGLPSPGTDYNDDFYKHPIFNKANFYRSDEE